MPRPEQKIDTEPAHNKTNPLYNNKRSPDNNHEQLFESSLQYVEGDPDDDYDNNQYTLDKQYTPHKQYIPNTQDHSKLNGNNDNDSMGLLEDRDHMENTPYTPNGSLNNRQSNYNNLHTPRDDEKLSTSSHSSSNGSDPINNSKKLTLLKNNSNRDLKRAVNNHKPSNFLTPQSPASPPATTPSPPSFRFALSSSPPTPHKERVPSANDPAVEVQKLRMQLQKALQEINGFKIYKVSIFHLQHFSSFPLYKNIPHIKFTRVYRKTFRQ